MEKLIEALQIFLKYKNANYPTHCEHDILMVVDIPEEVVSEKDKKRLEELDFFYDEEYDCWSSSKYGSA